MVPSLINRDGAFGEVAGVHLGYGPALCVCGIKYIYLAASGPSGSSGQSDTNVVRRAHAR